MKTIRLAAMAVLACLSWTGCGNRQAPSVTESTAQSPPESKRAKDEVILSSEQQRSVTIETRPAAVSQEPDVLRVKGRIALADDRTWKVGVRTLGSVVAVYKELGDFVHRGDILARYHADEVRDSRALYRAAVTEADRAEAAARQAERNRDRARRMLDLKAGSQQQVEQSEQDLVTAQAAARKAQIEVERLRDLLEDDLRVPAEPNPIRKSELEDDVPILAPGDGYIIEKNVTAGKSVDTASVTFVVADLSKVWMLASVRQEDLGKLRTGQMAVVTLGGQDDRRWAGRITNLGQELDPSTRAMQVRIELENRENRLRPEMLANADLPIGRSKATVVVPSDALQEVGDQTVVFVQTGAGRFSVRPVRAGEAADGKTPILEGLNAGDPVVVRGSFILKSQLLKSTLESE